MGGPQATPPTLSTDPASGHNSHKCQSPKPKPKTKSKSKAKSKSKCPFPLPVLCAQIPSDFAGWPTWQTVSASAGHMCVRWLGGWHKGGAAQHNNCGFNDLPAPRFNNNFFCRAFFFLVLVLVFCGSNWSAFYCPQLVAAFLGFSFA